MYNNVKNSGLEYILVVYTYENRDFAIAKSQFSTNPMLKKGLTHYKE